ncbi:MAG: crotonobetainyl-CoA:carnitine CoA-transferase CaiB-like acyl-CoA transferase, partial [Myxococcota bacterium]
SKLMVSLDLSKPESRKVIDDLIDWADVVCESFAPGKLAALGWGYDKLSAKKPELIMLSTSLMGQTGPLSSYAGYGNLAAAIAGFFDLTGWSDRPPAGPFGAYTDYVSPKFNALSLMAALEHRRRTGRGQHIDAAQAEAGLSFIAPALLDATINGRVPTRAGNRDELYAPHGCYPCAGEDRWIALAIEGDAEWATMCRTLGCKTLATDERFATLGSRRRNADELDREIGNYTAEFEAAKIEAVLQQAKLAAHEVLGSKALVVEPQLNARNHFLPRGDGGAIVESSRTVLSRTPAVVRDGLPLLGRDNHEVLTEILGYDDEAITALAIAGALE